MEINTFIEVQAFGDFDVTYTVCVMIHNEKLDKNILLDEFYKIVGITSNNGLDYKKLYTITQDFISFLELKGFKKLNTEKVYFCD